MARSCVSGQKTADRRPGGDQLPKGRSHGAPEGDAHFALKVSRSAETIGEADFDVLKSHGFDKEDIWDIAGIAAFFALSNRMANVTAMRPNAEFYTMGRA